jgi:triacylglycerol lipase
VIVKPVFLCLLLLGASLPSAFADAPSNGRTVVLLHGLARSASSMHRMELALQQEGYRVCNLDYPSREHSIAELASRYVAPRVMECAHGSGEPIDFVTHSMGGIIVRQLAASGQVSNIGRVVMLGPPNQGSEVVDKLGGWYLFQRLNGPAGSELGTAPDSLPNRLGPAKFETGVIAGSHSINWILSLLIPGPDDGKVSIARARLQGMRDFVEVEASHPFLMNDDQAIRQTIRFLQRGCFDHGPELPSLLATTASGVAFGCGAEPRPEASS